MSTKNLLLNHLKVILGSHVESDIVDYINSMKHLDDLEEFMENIIDKNNVGHVTAYEGICKILFGNKSPSKASETNIIPKNQEKSNKTNKAQKGKKRFSNINTFQEKKKQQEGRTICDCEGQEHEFMNNCLNCGRIHCYEEGPGPCFFCNEPLQEQVKALTKLSRSLEVDIEKLCAAILEIKESKTTLTKNISELYKTAKAEIDRKDRNINDLRNQLTQLNINTPPVPSVKRGMENVTNVFDYDINRMKRKYDDNHVRSSTPHKRTRTRSRSREKHMSKYEEKAKDARRRECRVYDFVKDQRKYNYEYGTKKAYSNSRRNFL